MAFSKNNMTTIQATGNSGLSLGRRDGLSKLDVVQINVLYDCKSKIIN